MNLTIRPHPNKLTVCLRKDEDGQLFAVILDQFDPDSLFVMVYQDGMKLMPAYCLHMSGSVEAHAPDAEELRQGLDQVMREANAEYNVLKELPLDWEDRA